MYSLAVRSMGGSEGPPLRDFSGFGAFVFRSSFRETAPFFASFSQRGFTYSHSPSLPPSRPKPLSLYPPNPAPASNRLVLLIHTVPACTLGAMSSARLMLSVHTLAARPYGVLLASATDSSGVRKVIVTSTGPKISTCAIVDDGCTFVKSVGG